MIVVVVVVVAAPPLCHAVACAAIVDLLARRRQKPAPHLVLLSQSRVRRRLRLLSPLCVQFSAPCQANAVGLGRSPRSSQTRRRHAAYPRATWLTPFCHLGQHVHAWLFSSQKVLLLGTGDLGYAHAHARRYGSGCVTPCGVCVKCSCVVLVCSVVRVCSVCGGCALPRHMHAHTARARLAARSARLVPRSGVAGARQPRRAARRAASATVAGGGGDGLRLHRHRVVVAVALFSSHYKSLNPCSRWPREGRGRGPALKKWIVLARRAFWGTRPKNLLDLAPSCAGEEHER